MPVAARNFDKAEKLLHHKMFLPDYRNRSGTGRGGGMIIIHSKLVTACSHYLIWHPFRDMHEGVKENEKEKSVTPKDQFPGTLSILYLLLH